MKVVIVGAGRVGFQVAKQLTEENQDVVLFEWEPETARYASGNLDCMVINDDGTSLRVLRKANIDNADFFISLTDSDEKNMIACGLVSSSFTIPYKIARVRNVDYSPTGLLEKSFLGIDFIVNPEIEAAKAIVNTIEHGALSDIMLFEKIDLQMRNISVAESPHFIDHTIEEIREELGLNFLVAVIMRENGFIIPSGNTVIRENDNLYVVGSEENLEKLFLTMGKEKLKLNKIVIVGGGTIGSYIARSLLAKESSSEAVVGKIANVFSRKKKKKNVYIIDRDYEKCKNLSEQIPEALVLNADISDEDVFDEELLNTDLLISTTENQELNIVTAIYAKYIGVKRTISLVNNVNYINVASNLGIDVPISLKTNLVRTIIKFIRKTNIKNVYSISGGKIEVIEVYVDESCRVLGKKLKEVKLPRQSLIISVTRGDENFVPDGEFVFRNGDYVILIVKKEFIQTIENLFAGAL